MVHVLEHVSGMADAELVGRLERLVKADRALSAKLLVHLGEVDARKLYCERAYSSMFEYCRSGLGMSEAEAALRIQAARVGRRFPLVLQRLGAGAVHLSAIKLLAPHLTADNHVQLLDRVRGMTKRQVEVLVADLAPKPDVPARIRKVPEPRKLFDANATAVVPEPSSLAVTATARPVSAPPSASVPTLAPAERSVSKVAPTAPVASSTFALQSPPSRATSTPLGRGRFKLVLTLGQEAQEALDQLVELCRHQNPSGDLTFIVERALIELRKCKMKQRFGLKGSSKAQAMIAPAPKADVEETRGARSLKSRHIPRAVRREVHARDEEQCTFVSADGRRCTERGFIEVHHHNTTFARGGDATIANLRLMCRAHNMFLAEQDYGRSFMQQKLHDSRERNSKSQSLVPGTAGS